MKSDSLSLQRKHWSILYIKVH